MDNNLNNVKAGEFIWTIQSGWVEVRKISTNNITTMDEHRYDLIGRQFVNDRHPSAFLKPPEGFLSNPEELLLKQKMQKERQQLQELIKGADNDYSSVSR